MAEPRRSAGKEPGDLKGARILIVEARFYEISPTRCSKGATRALDDAGAVFERVSVPGSLEIPPAIAIALDAAERAGKPYEGAVALGCVIRGDTICISRSCRSGIRARADGAFGTRAACRSATASSPSTPTRRPGRAPGSTRPTRAATPRARRSRWCGSSAAWPRAEPWPAAPLQGRAQGQPARRRAACRRAGALPDGYRRHRPERHPGRVREPLDRPRGRGRPISAGGGGVLPRRGRRRGARAAQLDPLIDEALAQGWPLKRIEAILRAVLRAGAYELDHRRDVPARVVVSEYVDVANAFVDERRDRHGQCRARPDRAAISCGRVHARHQVDDELIGRCCGTATMLPGQPDIPAGRLSRSARTEPPSRSPGQAEPPNARNGAVLPQRVQSRGRGRIVLERSWCPLRL